MRNVYTETHLDCSSILKWSRPYSVYKQVFYPDDSCRSPGVITDHQIKEIISPGEIAALECGCGITVDPTEFPPLPKPTFPRFHPNISSYSQPRAGNPAGSLFTKLSSYKSSIVAINMKAEALRKPNLHQNIMLSGESHCNP